MRAVYWFNPDYCHTDLAMYFAHFDQALMPRGKCVTSSSNSHVYHFTAGNISVYIKRYLSAGKYLRRFIGRSRSRAEWENMQYFADHNIPVPTLIAYGERRIFGLFTTGVIVTEALPHCCDLATMASNQPNYLTNRTWLTSIMQRIAEFTFRLHHQGFIHNDLKWRNILVDKNAATSEVYFIDCPIGRKRYNFLHARGVIKDLACLDKIARQILSRTQRLRFYYYYIGANALQSKHKKQVKKIVNFFSGRDS